MSSLNETAVGKALGMKPPKPLVSAQWFSRRLNKAIAPEQEPQFKTKKTFGPSTIGGYYGRCARYWWHAFSGAEFVDSPSVKNRRAMDSGTAAHEALQKAMESIDEVTEIELEIRVDDPPIFGFADFVIEHDGAKVIGEIKTVPSNKLDYIRSMKSAVPAHIVQVLLYMWATDADEGMIIYEDRDSFARKVFSVVRSEYNIQYTQEILNWMRQVRAAWEQDQKPKRCFTKSSVECKYCPLAETCWSEADGTEDIGRLPVRD